MSKFPHKFDDRLTLNEVDHWFLYVFEALAGAHHTKPTHADREFMKECAAMRIAEYPEPNSPILRMPYFLLRAYAHWLRAFESEMALDADDFDERFSEGINFRRYLGAWLYSVGVPKLAMTARDLEAIADATHVAMLPHPLMPIGYSTFLPGVFTTTAVDKIPVTDLSLHSVNSAFLSSESV